MNCKFIRICAAVLVFVLGLSVVACAEGLEPEVMAEAAILIDADTGEVLFAKNESQKMYPASTTKVMVALLALENLELDEIITANNSVLNLLPPGHTNIGIKNGEQLSVRQLLYGLLVSSAGDAANVLGERISGSVDEFIKLMNTRAMELGMANTNYVNASGAHDDLHYTTASDMAILAREAMKYDVFREIVKTDVYIIPATEQYTEDRRLLNTNHLVSKRKTSLYYYEYATGIKTGFTNQAKRCLVSSATKNGINLICVVLGADVVDMVQRDFADSKNLFEYGFANYKRTNVVEKGTIVAQAPIKSAKSAKQVLLEAGGDLSQLIAVDSELGVVERTDIINENIKAPVKKGDVLGTAEFFVDSVSIGTISLVADKDYAFDPIKNVLNVVGSILTSPFLYLPFILFFIILLIIRQYNYNKKRKELREARRIHKQQEAERRNATMRKEDFVDDFLKK
ncbi:MAG: D-alanyl-D-alanine carboxypeptidase family protein [Clostridia bacterium]